MVRSNCVLLKASDNMSKVPEGVMRLPNKSRPYAKRIDVDSRRAGEATTCLVPISCEGVGSWELVIPLKSSFFADEKTHIVGMRQGSLRISDQ